MLERDNNGKFVKRSLVANPNEIQKDNKQRSCNDEKLAVIEWQLQSTQSQLEVWQREYAKCDHKDREDIGQLVAHYSWRVAQWQQMLIDCLNESDDCCKKDPMP